MKILIAAFTLLLITSASFSQTTDSTAKSNAVAQATKMANLLLKKDYKAFAGFTYAPILNMFGGADKMRVYLEKGIKEMEDGGFSMKEISIDNCSAIVHTGNQWQCTLTEVVLLAGPDSKLKLRSTLIGISGNKGLTWKYIDTHRAPLKDLQKTVKELSDDLIIPEPMEPELIGN